MKHDFDEVHDRRGTYCTQWDYIQDRFGRPGILPFSISDTDFLPPRPIVDAVTQVASRGQYGYTRWNHHDYKGSIAGWFERRYDTEVNEDWIVYSPSVMYSISLLVRLLTKPGDGILVFDPMYDSFPGVIEGNGRRMVRSILLPVVHPDPADDARRTFEIDFDEIDRLAVGCKAMLLCSPHNPTGRMWTADEMDRIIGVCRDHGLYLITDEIHADISVCGRTNVPALSRLATYDRVVTASSSTKTFNTPGLIGSYAVIPLAELREAFLNQTRHVDYLNSCSTLGMYATMVGYNECEDYVGGLCDYVRGNMGMLEGFLAERFPQIYFEVPDATYLAWIDVSGLGVSSAELQDALVNVGGVGIMRGETYGDAGEGHLRMCVGCPSEKLRDGLARFERGVCSLGIGAISDAEGSR